MSLKTTHGTIPPTSRIVVQLMVLNNAPKTAWVRVATMEIGVQLCGEYYSLHVTDFLTTGILAVSVGTTIFTTFKGQSPSTLQITPRLASASQHIMHSSK